MDYNLIDDGFYIKLDDATKADIGDYAEYGNGLLIDITASNTDGQLFGDSDGCWLIFGVEIPTAIWRKVEWKQGDIVRDVHNGTLVEVDEFQPEYRRSDEFAYVGRRKGFTYKADDGEIRWACIKNYELVDSESKEEKVEMEDKLIKLANEFAAAVQDLVEESKEENLGKVTGELSEGDLVVVIPGTRYIITTEEMKLGRVEGTHGEEQVKVKVMAHEGFPEEEGEAYPIDKDAVRLVSESEFEEIFSDLEGKTLLASVDGEFGNISAGDKVELDEADFGIAEDGDINFLHVKNEQGRYDWFALGELKEVKKAEVHRFEVGDLVQANDLGCARYNISGEDMILAKVIDENMRTVFGEDGIQIEVLIHKDPSEEGIKLRVTKDSMQPAELVKEDIPVKVGAIYKTKTIGEYGDVGEGSLVEVEDVKLDILLGKDDYFIYVEDTEDGETDWFRMNDLEEVSEEESETGKNHKVEAGDIVYFKDPVWFESSGFGEVVYTSGRGARILGTDSDGEEDSWFLHNEEFKLVAKNEDRVDN